MSKYIPITLNSCAGDMHIVMGRVDHKDGLPEFKEVKMNTKTVGLRNIDVTTFDSKKQLLKLFNMESED